MSKTQRGITGYKFQCVVSTCDAHDIKWAPDAHTHINSYTDAPESWGRDYGVHFCEEHKYMINEHAEATKRHKAAEDVAMAPHREAIKAAYIEWTSSNPRPVAPWAKP